MLIKILPWFYGGMFQNIYLAMERQTFIAISILILTSFKAVLVSAKQQQNTIFSEKNVSNKELSHKIFIKCTCFQPIFNKNGMLG